MKPFLSSRAESGGGVGGEGGGGELLNHENIINQPFNNLSSA